MSAHTYAGRVHSAVVQIVAGTIDQNERPADTLAAEAGIPPSRFRAILAGAEVLTLADLAGIGQVLGVRPSHLLRLAEETADVTGH